MMDVPDWRKRAGRGDLISAPLGVCCMKYSLSLIIILALPVSLAAEPLTVNGGRIPGQRGGVKAGH